MKRETSWLFTFLLCLAPLWAKAQPPNIIFILADDLGYGDVGCYNPESKIPTPYLDQLAKEGMRFTDAHSPSTVCTPSRYSLLTGQYCWRSPYKRGVLTGVDGPLIAPDRLTVPAFLKQNGYNTACIGKWHVGMTFFNREGKPVAPQGGGVRKVKQVDFTRPIKNGPNDTGFNHFFGTACCPTTDWLYAYIENDRVVQAPTKMSGRNGTHWLQYGYHRDGFQAPDFDFAQVDMLFMEKSIEWMANHVQKKPKQPFFLYHASQSAHLPAIPAPQFVGRSKAGPLGDFIYEFDYVVGHLLDTVDKLGIRDNTLIIVSSDNGPEIVITQVRRDFKHDSARPWRGMKRDNWEGGHRVPFIARWPGKIPAGSISHETICLTDLMATCAGILEKPLPENAGEDSVNILPVLLGKKPEKALRQAVIHHTLSGKLALRQGKWKYLAHQGSGGNNYERNEHLKPYIIEEKDPDAPGQLYDLAADPGETNNLYSKQPEVTKRLQRLFDEITKTER